MGKYARIISLMAAAALLCSCGNAGTAPQKPSDQVTEAGGSTEASQSEKQEQTQQDAEAEKEKEKQKLLAQGAGSAGIRTDYSAYSSGKTKDRYTRLTDAWIPDLKEGSDYGSIYPFEGEPIYGKSEDGYAWVIGYKTGFLDEKGRIIADPTYVEVNRLTYYDSINFHDIQTDFWRFCRTDVAEEQKFEEDFFYDLGNVKYGVANADGSFVTECKYDIVYAMECGVVLVDDYEKGSFTLVDWDGNICFTDQDITFRDRINPQDFQYMNYGEGIFVVNLKDGQYYMDEHANLLWGPYYSASPFSEGRAVVTPIGPREYDEPVGVIDQDGKWVVKPGDYSSIGAFRNGYAEATSDEAWESRDHYLIDLNGKVVYNAGHHMIDVYKDGYVITSYSYDNKNDQTFLNLDLQNISDQYLQGEEVCGSLELVSKNQAGALTVRNVKTGQKIKFSDDKYIRNLTVGGGIDAYTDPRYFIVESSSGEEYGNYDIYRTSDMKKIFEGVDYAWIEKDDADPEKIYFLIMRPGDYREIYDENQKLIGRYRGTISLINGNIAVLGSESTRYYDLEGKEWFRYSFRVNDD